jgi:hypothetical protein
MTWACHYIPENKAELMTRKYPLFSQNKKFDSAVSSYCCLRCLCCSAGSLHTSRFNNKCSCLIRKLKRLKEAIRQKGPGYWPNEFFFCTTMLQLTVLLQVWISWPLPAGKFFHVHHTILICTVVPLTSRYPPQRSIVTHLQPLFLPQCERPNLIHEAKNGHNYGSVYLILRS